MLTAASVHAHEAAHVNQACKCIAVWEMCTMHTQPDLSLVHVHCTLSLTCHLCMYIAPHKYIPYLGMQSFTLCYSVDTRLRMRCQTQCGCCKSMSARPQTVPCQQAAPGLHANHAVCTRIRTPALMSSASFLNLLIYRVIELRPFDMYKRTHQLSNL